MMMSFGVQLTLFQPGGRGQIIYDHHIISPPLFSYLPTALLLHTKLGGLKRSNERTDQHDSVDIKLAPFFLCFESIDKGLSELGG